MSDPYLHFDVSPEVRALIRAAVALNPRLITGSPRRIEEWAKPILIEAALLEVGYPTLGAWLEREEEDL